jgi:hypothetical protein
VCLHTVCMPLLVMSPPQIGRAFLQPYDLNSDASTFTADNTTGPVHQALQGLDPQAVQVYAYRPFSNAGGGGNSRYGCQHRSGRLPGQFAFKTVPCALGVLPAC